MKTRVLWSSACAAAIVFSGMALHAADDNAKPASGEKVTDKAGKAEEGKLKGRLPNHFSKIVDSAQKEKIYVIQAAYTAKLEALEKAIEALEAQRNAEIRALLSAEQLKKIDELIAAAKTKSPAKPATEPKPDAASAAK